MMHSSSKKSLTEMEQRILKALWCEGKVLKSYLSDLLRCQGPSSLDRPLRSLERKGYIIISQKENNYNPLMCLKEEGKELAG